MSLIEPLRVTTRTPIWVHPLLWRLDHLDAFHISISTDTAGAADYPRNDRRPTTMSHGFIRSRDLRYILQDINLLETYLASFLARTINSFQKALKPRPFRFYSQDQNPRPPSPLFTFLNHVMQIHPELVIRTRKGFPFLIYNCPGTLYTLRQNFTNTRAGTDIEWLLKKTVVKLDFTLEVVDPYNVAAVLAIAQEQHSWFCRSNLTPPEILKVHLITPHPTLAAVHFYTAEVPLWYLEALMDPYLKVAGEVKILKEFVELPVPPASAQAVITTGPFLEKVGEILEEMRILNSV